MNGVDQTNQYGDGETFTREEYRRLNGQTVVPLELHPDDSGCIPIAAASRSTSGQSARSKSVAEEDPR